MLKAAEDVNIELKERAFLKATLNVLDKVFTIIFVFEMFVKICAYGFRKYFTDAWCWLDFIIVAVRIDAFTSPVASIQIYFGGGVNDGRPKECRREAPRAERSGDGAHSPVWGSVGPPPKILW